MPSITVPATLTSLNDAQNYLKAHIPPAFAAQTTNILLVAEELLVNVFSYAYPEETTGKAEIRLEEEDDSLIFTVRDWGAPFNPFTEAPAPDLTSDIETRPMGGLGIYLIRKVSDRQTYTYEAGANTITIGFAHEPRPC